MQNFFCEKYPAAKKFREVPLTNIDNLRSLFKGKGAKGRLSFAPGMASSTLNNQMKGLAVNIEGSGDSDDVLDLSDDERADGDEESRSPIKNTRKRKSGGSASVSKRQSKEIDDTLRILKTNFGGRSIEVQSTSPAPPPPTPPTTISIR